MQIGLRRQIGIWRYRFCGAKRPWLSLWESCQPNRLTERVPQSEKGASLWCGTLSVCPVGAASSPIGRAKVASLRKNDTAKFQFAFSNRFAHYAPILIPAPAKCNGRMPHCPVFRRGRRKKDYDFMNFSFPGPFP